MFNIDIDSILRELRLKKESGEKKFSTVIDHTRMEELLYRDKKSVIDQQYEGIDYTIEEIQRLGNEKLNTFAHLSQDLFNMFYKLAPGMREEESLESNISRFNKKIVEKVMENPEYKALKLITEGNDLESIEGTREFTKNLYDNLDSLLQDMAGNKEVLNQLEKTEQVKAQKEQELEAAAQMYQEGKEKGLDEQILQGLMQKATSLQKQVEGVEKKRKGFEDIILVESHKNEKEIGEKIGAALKHALDKVQEVKDYLESWSTEDGRPTTIEGKTELIKKVNSNLKFKEMARCIGHMRRMLSSALHKTYTQGMGEKVGIEFGNKLNKILPSEYVLLALPQTQPLFYKKYLEKKLKQYKERAPQHEGMGNIIVCNDESGSTRGGKELWSKALAIALLDVARKEHRTYTYIPFSSRVGGVIEVTAENYTQEIMLTLANNFLSGGTNFDLPLEKALELLEKDQYSNADLVFITDGESSVNPKTVERLAELKNKKGTKCVGILLDKGEGSVSDYSLKQFADKIYKTSEISEDAIAGEVLRGVI